MNEWTCEYHLKKKKCESIMSCLSALLKVSHDECKWFVQHWAESKIVNKLSDSQSQAWDKRWSLSLCSYYTILVIFKTEENQRIEKWQWSSMDSSLTREHERLGFTALHLSRIADLPCNMHCHYTACSWGGKVEKRRLLIFWSTASVLSSVGAINYSLLK